MLKVFEKIEQIGIVPVVKIDSIEQVRPLLQALITAGLNCVEITLRSQFALESIKIAVNEFPEVLVGAGTVISCNQAREAISAGAQFIVTPGYNSELTKFVLDNNVAIIPGVTTASEIMQAIDDGLEILKFFPAETSGGWSKIKDFSGPFPKIKFMPTGGIDLVNMLDYLNLNNVIAIGGSFMLKGLNDMDFERVYQDSKNAINKMLGYELIHVGIDNDNCETARKNALLMCELFGFPYYEKPKSHFASKGFEFLNNKGPGQKGHLAIYTPFIERALYQLKRKGIMAVEDTVTRNKKTNKINFVYLDLELSGFAVHLINPDIKM